MNTPEKDGEIAASMVKKALDEANSILEPHGCRLLVSIGFQVIEKVEEKQILEHKS